MKAEGPVAVIGLGAMGAAIADALHAAGHDLVVWNRSPERMQAYRERGVACAENIGDVLERCQVIIICIAALCGNA
ncbi:MAG: NAD(P)-binding domain-containing protein [Woeseiaceae bacterium]|nr:NAD(P)-binding domain-containing protein [Woeseiaceae bacterium]